MKTKVFLMAPILMLITLSPRVLVSPEWYPIQSHMLKSEEIVSPRE